MAIRTRHNSALQEKIRQMRLSLSPIYPLPMGEPHSAFSYTVLHFWLLTEDELDSMAAYYHQTSPSNPWRMQYPACMHWDVEFLARPDPAEMSREEMDACLGSEERLVMKRRMFGKFIGLRGCDTPVEEYEKRVKFLEERIERKLQTERDMAGRKWPNYY